MLPPLLQMDWGILQVAQEGSAKCVNDRRDQGKRVTTGLILFAHRSRIRAARQGALLARTITSLSYTGDRRTVASELSHCSLASSENWVR